MSSRATEFWQKGEIQEYKMNIFSAKIRQPLSVCTKLRRNRQFYPWPRGSRGYSSISSIYSIVYGCTLFRMNGKRGVSTMQTRGWQIYFSATHKTNQPPSHPAIQPSSLGSASLSAYTYMMFYILYVHGIGNEIGHIDWLDRYRLTFPNRQIPRERGVANIRGYFSVRLYGIRKNCLYNIMCSMCRYI